MLTNKSRGLLTTALLSTAWLVGCGGAPDDRPATVPVTGTVAYNGQPVEGATVSFMAEGAPRAATGVTDAEGKFELSTFDLNDGAVPGNHKVTITKGAGAAAGETPDMRALEDPTALANTYQQDMDAAEKSESELPEKYSKPQTTPLTAEVTEEPPPPFVFNLSD